MALKINDPLYDILLVMLYARNSSVNMNANDVQIDATNTNSFYNTRLQNISTKLNPNSVSKSNSKWHVSVICLPFVA